MAKRLDIDDLIRSNPNVDPEQLTKGRKLLREIRDARKRVGKQKLASPINRRRVLMGKEPSKHPRTTQLRNRDGTPR